MKIQVEVEIPQNVVDRVMEIVIGINGRAPSCEQLEAFFKQDAYTVYDQYACDHMLKEVVESFFYVEEETK